MTRMDAHEKWARQTYERHVFYRLDAHYGLPTLEDVLRDWEGVVPSDVVLEYAGCGTHTVVFGIPKKEATT